MGDGNQVVGGPEEDFSIEPELRLLVKKLTKKDNVTKLKALQEFAELVPTKDEKSLTAFLLYWPRLFNKLAVVCNFIPDETMILINCFIGL